ncbi:GNAT family N-acetyltransferase [Brachybacterium sp. JHP9]|uniref:GNAT family N-acetyltransferase n=1 Tax=Brachybacterium equifaecis TaxID=2910770 RepID=A0ABT0R404_9MICO|nr:GNAT family N-acetyltransferase [Brachybacterium equifaecis]MCL6424218.1 GNAT family N-acetyltransferase [Brachybacterium equifaecis]
MSDLCSLFPPFALEIQAGDLTLRLLRDADLPEYTDLLRRPIFADETADHVFPWYAVPEQERIRGALAFQWSLRSGLSAEKWALALGIWAHGELIGCQDLNATDFARRRTIGSGSWLTLDAQGRGYGKLMRQAALVLAFDHLGARRAESAAILGNAPSFGVSRSCGYALNGSAVVLEGGKVVEHQGFVVTPETFVRPEVPVRVSGLGADLRAMLGAEER